MSKGWEARCYSRHSFTASNPTSIRPSLKPLMAFDREDPLLAVVETCSRTSDETMPPVISQARDQLSPRLAASYLTT